MERLTFSILPHSEVMRGSSLFVNSGAKASALETAGEFLSTLPPKGASHARENKCNVRRYGAGKQDKCGVRLLEE